MNEVMKRWFSMRRFVIAAAWVAAWMMAAPGDLAAQEFRIDNQVFDGKTKIGGSTTIYAAEKTYDFVSVPAEVVVYDPATQRFTLLDDTRKLRCDLTTEQVADFCDRLRERSKQSDSSYAQFMATPDFSQDFDVEKKELVLNSAFMVYRAKTVAARDTESLRRYQDFTFRQAQLNTVLTPGSQPPFARLKLHGALAERQLMAEEVTLKRATVIPNFGKLLKAEHKITWSLDDADRKRVAEADEHAKTYAPLSVAEFLKPAQ